MLELPQPGARSRLVHAFGKTGLGENQSETDADELSGGELGSICSNEFNYPKSHSNQNPEKRFGSGSMWKALDSRFFLFQVFGSYRYY